MAMSTEQPITPLAEKVVSYVTFSLLVFKVMYVTAFHQVRLVTLCRS